VTPPVDDAAWVAGGILSSTTGELALSLTVEQATELLISALEPRERIVRWDEPDKAAVTRLEDTLNQAWAAATRSQPSEGWDEPVLRLAVGDLTALEALGPVSFGGLRVATHVDVRAHRLAWRWPVRVGVASTVLADQVGGDQVEVQVLSADTEGSFEFVVLDAAGADIPRGVEAACVVLPGATAGTLDPSVLQRVRVAGVAAVVVSPVSDVSWFASAVRHLACGRPLDVAIALAEPTAVLLANNAFLGLTSAPEYARELAGGLRRADPATGGEAVAEALADLERLAEAPFDADGRAGAELADIVDSVSSAGLETLTTVGVRHLRAKPPPPPPPPSFEGGAEVDRGSEAAPSPPVPPDARRLQAQVLHDDTGKVLDDRFVGGAVHQLKIRIAAEVIEGVVVGDAAFVSPTPGRDADLTVEVIAGDTHARRKLELPAVGASGWTRAVPVTVPADAKDFEVFVQVWFGSRVVQSAVLSGPVLDVGAPPPPEKLRLSVDASTPVAAVHRMTPADASITIVPGLTGEPVALGFDQGQPIQSDDLARANQGVRSVLLETFRKPAPASLAEAARPLTRLAVRGRILHDTLLETMEGFPGDDARWVQVSGFGSADLPLELVYTHRKPMSDDEVPVCPTALGGATDCAASCPDRARNDVVCPYGFWATSKVIERRRHVGTRVKNQAGSERTVALLNAAAAGVAVKADEVDKGASRRILDAVKAAVADGRFLPVSTWAEVGDAAKAPPTIIVLITHTVPGEGDLDTDLQLGTDLIRAHKVADDSFLNPGQLEPGPVVIAIGCDTADIDTSFGNYVRNLHRGGAELVVSAISPVPGQQVADFVVRFFAALPAYLATPGIHRFGEVLTAVRRQTVATGDVLGLALTASGDADVALQGV